LHDGCDLGVGVEAGTCMPAQCRKHSSVWLWVAGCWLQDSDEASFIHASTLQERSLRERRELPAGRWGKAGWACNTSTTCAQSAFESAVSLNIMQCSSLHALGRHELLSTMNVVD
jgi:hypothetical protein